MNNFENYKLTWLQLLVMSVLKTGSIPKHIAFIMDGNRRFAKKIGVEKVAGHTNGYNKLIETLSWCIHFGIQEITFYAFSIDNLKRSQEEIDDLTNLANQKFKIFLDKKDVLMEFGICVRIIGNFSLIRPDLRETMYELTQVTKSNSKTYLNIAYCYKFTDEITCTIRDIVKSVANEEIIEEDIDESLISQCLYTHKSADLDLLIRTSGEVRFSDFLLWQTSFTCVYFCKVLWPEFSIWNLCSAIFYYQRCYKDLKRTKSSCESDRYVPNIRKSNCIKKIHSDREAVLMNN